MAEEIIGYPRKELIGKNFLHLKLLSPRQILKAAKLLAMSALRQPTGPDEFTLNRKDGRKVTVDIRTFPVDMDDRTLVLGIARDVTARKFAEIKLERMAARLTRSNIERQSTIETKNREFRELDGRFQSFMTNSPALAYIKDENGRLVYVNEPMQALFTNTQEDWRGKTAFELCPRETAQKIAEQEERALTRGETVELVISASFPGSTEPRSLLTYKFPLTDMSGRPFVGGWAIDITEREQLRKQHAILQERNQRAAVEWTRTMDAVDAAIFVIDSVHRIVRMNRAARDLTGRSYAENIGSTIASFSSAQPWQRVTELVEAVMSGRKPARCSVRDESSGIDWEISVSLSPGLQGSDDLFVVVAEDISEKVRLEETVRGSEVMAVMGSLVGGVAHEVRNPLFGISATLDAFAARFGDRADFKEYIEVLREEVGRLSELMHDLLEYGRPSTLVLEEGNLERIIDDAVNRCENLAKQREIHTVNRVKDSEWKLMMDPMRLTHAFLNIIDNAVQHSSPGDEVKIEATEIREDGQAWVECRIDDQGPGFRPGEAEHVFDPFFTRRKGGTGLGLALVHRIIEQHGGTVCAANHPEGGARVTVRLPMTDLPGVRE